MLRKVVVLFNDFTHPTVLVGQEIIRWSFTTTAIQSAVENVDDGLVLSYQKAHEAVEMLDCNRWLCFDATVMHHVATNSLLQLSEHKIGLVVVKKSFNRIFNTRYTVSVWCLEEETRPCKKEKSFISFIF